MQYQYFDDVRKMSVDKQAIKSRKSKYRTLSIDQKTQELEDDKPRFFDKFIEPNREEIIVAIFLNSCSLYESILDGIKLRYRNKQSCFNHKHQHQIPHDPCNNNITKIQRKNSISQNKSNITKDFEQSNNCECEHRKDDSNKSIEERFPKRKKFVWFIYFFLIYINLYSFIFNSIIFVLEAGSLESFWWLDCVLPGRVLWRPSVTDKGRIIAIVLSIISFSYRCLNLSKNVFHIDWLDFLFSPKEFVWEEISKSSKKKKVDKITNSQPINDDTKNHVNRKVKFSSYNPTFYILTTYGLVLKLNRTYKCWRSMTYLNSIIILLAIFLFVSSLWTLPGFYVFSQAVYNENLAYPFCNSYLHSRLNKTFVLPTTETGLINILNSKFIFDNPLMSYHGFFNGLYIIWFSIEVSTMTTTATWITVMTICDLILYSRAIKTDLELIIDNIMNCRTNKRNPNLKNIVDSTYYQLITYFNILNAYQKLVLRFTIFITATNGFLVIPIIAGTIVRMKLFDDLEVYVVIIYSFFFLVSILVSSNYVRKESIVLYKLVAKLTAILPNVKNRSRYLGIFSYFKPKPLYCFRLGTDELSLMYGLRVSMNACILYNLIRLFKIL